MWFPWPGIQGCVFVVVVGEANFAGDVYAVVCHLLTVDFKPYNWPSWYTVTFHIRYVFSVTETCDIEPVGLSSLDNATFSSP